jgi:hypothetical protein
VPEQQLLDQFLVQLPGLRGSVGPASGRSLRSLSQCPESAWEKGIVPGFLAKPHRYLFSWHSGLAVRETVEIETNKLFPADNVSTSILCIDSDGANGSSVDFADLTQKERDDECYGEFDTAILVNNLDDNMSFIKNTNGKYNRTIYSPFIKPIRFKKTKEKYNQIPQIIP